MYIRNFFAYIGIQTYMYAYIHINILFEMVCFYLKRKEKTTYLNVALFSLLYVYIIWHRNHRHHKNNTFDAEEEEKI